VFVLVTGGAGFIGSHTVDALLGLGARVRVLDDLSTGSLNNLPKQLASLEFVQGDVRNEACVVNSMQGITHVLHLAAQVSVPISIHQPVHSHSVNVAGYLNVLNAARMAGVKRVVHASSAAVYGVPVKLPLTEDSPVSPLSPYGLEKIVTDQYAQLFRVLYSLSTLGLRYFNVYGPRQNPRSPYSGVISKFAALAREGSPFTICGDGMQTRDFIYVKDVAQANTAALQSQFNGVINVATGESVTLLDMVQIFSSYVGHPIEVNQAPAREGDIKFSSVTPTLMRNTLAVRETLRLNVGIAQLFPGL
jgi:UDP-glucose 4-epimerase